MGIRFVFGPSGSGKSNTVFHEIVEKSMEGCPEGGLARENYLIVVPDQFTMQTQKELVNMHPRGGIMNIDILSFSRLCHRILEEVGGEKQPVLDDTGKSLVLKKVAASLTEELPSLGALLKKQGYIHEVKSAISEFMQYGLLPEDVKQLAEYAGKRGALRGKLHDLELLYRGFLAYIKNHYITTEETLAVACQLLRTAPVVQNSTLVFDGFTGFTPIQNTFILELEKYAKEVIVTLPLGVNEDPYVVDGEQKLFYLSKKAVKALVGQEKDRDRNVDVFLNFQGKQHRFSESPALAALEKNLFHSPVDCYTDPQNSIFLAQMEDPSEEVRQVGIQITRLIREEGYQFRDIGVIAGNLESYASFVETHFQDMDIPFFMDRTRGISLNPMVEYIKSALNIYIYDFSPETVMHYLRSGLSGISFTDIDYLENYLIQTGIRGKKKWSARFDRKGKRGAEVDLARVNAIREKIMENLTNLDGEEKISVAEHVQRLYCYLRESQVEEQLNQWAETFEGKSELEKAGEYHQVYRKIMDLLDQVNDLLADEVIDRAEFYEILEAGIGEIEIGSIPQNVDRIVVGDMERTRLAKVKVLFFLGVNEGYIPKSTSKGGIISDLDREFLRESGMELSPSPREQMFIQRLYLYLNLTKPSEKLYLSYSEIGSEGKAMRPSYLVKTIQRIFPEIEIQKPQNRSVMEQLVSQKQGLDYLARGLRDYAEGKLGNLTEKNLQEGTPQASVLREAVLPEGGLQKKELLGLYHAYQESDLLEFAQQMEEAAFQQYRDRKLDPKVAGLLYGWTIDSNISRMESYAACAYRHFLQYGLLLEKREEFSFEHSDVGNTFHEILNRFAEKVDQSDYTWFDFPKDWAEEVIDATLKDFTQNYGAGIMESTERYKYQNSRFSRILKRTIHTLQEHIQKGVFKPYAHEVGFQVIHDMEELNLELSEEERIRLKGRIDRVDLAEDEDKIYVKIIDYKSGNKDFDLTALYYGLQLQLVVYMDVTMKMQTQRQEKLCADGKQKAPKEVVPAALLYYHVDDPLVEAEGESIEAINEKIRKSLRMKGIVNDDLEIIHKLDQDMGDKSEVIPVELKKDGSFSSASKVMSSEDIQVLSAYTSKKIQSFCREILTGNISKNPYERKEESACGYCAYREVCGFDLSIPGYRKRRLTEVEGNIAMEQIRREIQGETQENVSAGNSEKNQLDVKKNENGAEGSGTWE